MPNVVVTCTFNPPDITVRSASLRQETIDALQKALPKHTTTSMPTQRKIEPCFLLTSKETTNGGNENVAPDTSKYSSWKIELAQHYCCQKGRAMFFLTIMEALEEEGFAMRGVHTVVRDDGKDVTRMIFARA
ncbi:unnamed protein product [Phytomonas sp. Hart1]|nr:unnamed protein product [Phytomonas sp. Hart1]|eukprot:CCW68465.1 unnamed protein product [Phytomonas sp. isolate Hart1]